MVEFSDWSGLEIRLVYHPPYHSQSNAIERCWSAVEQTWGGSLLSSLTGILREAGRMVWCGQHASVHHLAGTWADGVKLTKKEMKPIEARLERSKTLPKYDITIRPKQPRGGSIKTRRTPNATLVPARRASKLQPAEALRAM